MNIQAILETNADSKARTWHSSDGIITSGAFANRKTAIEAAPMAVPIRPAENQPPAAQRPKHDAPSNTSVGNPKPDALWHSQESEAWASVGKENFRINSPQFRSWLAGEIHRRGGKPSEGRIKELCDVFGAKARFDNPQYQVHIRTAFHDGALWIDLADVKRNAVRVDAAGWRVVPSAQVPVKFQRPANMRALPEPSREGADASYLGDVLNLKDPETLNLVLTFLSYALVPNHPYPLLSVSGPAGSAKSTFSEIIRNVIDPNAVPHVGAPALDALVAVARNNHVLCFDNMTSVSPSLADAMCRLATGGGLGGRRLYTNDDEATFSAIRPMVVNGINDLATRGDLADRALVIRLDAISESERRSKGEVDAAFTEFHPLILAGLLNLIVVGLRRLPEVSSRRQFLPRMADFALWGLAVAPALRWSESDFRLAYRANSRAALHAAAEDDPIVGRILEVIDLVPGKKLEGSPTQVWSRLRGADRFQQNFPQSPEVFSRLLRRAEPLLEAHGITVERPRTNKVRTIIIRRIR
jgi:putative DNA primase/helicase